MRRRGLPYRGTFAAALLAVATVVGCRSTVIMGSDVALPFEMQEVEAADVTLSDDRFVSGTVELVGPSEDAGETMQRTMSAMKQHGWNVASNDSDASEAVATFEKDSRTCTIEIRRNADDPDRSVAVVTVIGGTS